MKNQEKVNVNSNIECACRAMQVSTSEHGGRVQNNLGFTLVELTLVAAIIGVLVTFAIPSYNLVKNRAETARCIAEIRGLENTINAYAIDKGSLPDSLSEIGQGNLMDPWKRPYQYLNIAKAPGDALLPFIGPAYNSDFDLYSKGPDGTTAQESDPATAPTMDDIIRGGDGGYVGHRNY